MPWSGSSFAKHNKSLRSPHAKAVAAKIANQVLSRTGDEGRAIREANAAVGRMRRK
jgi:uncharacterized protein YdaT